MVLSTQKIEVLYFVGQNLEELAQQARFGPYALWTDAINSFLVTIASEIGALRALGFVVRRYQLVSHYTC